MTIDDSKAQNTQEIKEVYSQIGIIGLLKNNFPEEDTYKVVSKLLLNVQVGFEILKEDFLRKNGMKQSEILAVQLVDCLVFETLFYGKTGK